MSRAEFDEHVADSIEILGVRIGTQSVESLVAWIIAAARSGRKACVAYVNVYAVNLAQEQGWFREFLDSADLTYCDGFGVRWGARLLGLHTPQRYTPPDWIGLLCAQCAQQGLSLFLLGARPGVAERAAGTLQIQFPSLRIAGTHHGYFDKLRQSIDNQGVLDTLATARPDILLVAFGMPRQERWIAENREQIGARVILPVGALFDYVTGEVVRAPHWMTDHGFEWLGRLIVEPWRLWRRYLVGNPVFFWRVIRRWSGQRT